MLCNVDDLDRWCQLLEECFELMFLIKKDLSQGRGPTPTRLGLPKSLGESWLHLVAGFCLISVEDFSNASVEMDSCCHLLTKGHRELRQSLMKEPLHEREAVLPLGIMTLFVKRLLRDVTFGAPDICSSYHEYLQVIVSILA